jgi:alpha-mannosidase
MLENGYDGEARFVPAAGEKFDGRAWTPYAGAALLNETKYGYRCTGNELELTLLHAGYDPDPYPDQGPHMIRYSLLPHAGDWQAGQVAQAARAFNLPALALETPPASGGDMPTGAALMSLQPDNLVLSCVKKAEEGDALIVRFHEAHGRRCRATLTLPKPPKAVARVDLLEQPLTAAAAASIDGAAVTVDVKPHKVVTLRVE